MYSIIKIIIVFNFIEIKFICNKLHIFEMYNLLGTDIRMDPQNSYHCQDSEHIRDA